MFGFKFSNPFKIVLVLFFVLVGCNRSVNYNFTVRGRLSDLPKHKIYAHLYHALPTGNVLLDSTLVDKDGRFVLHGKAHGLDFYVVNFTGQNYNIYLLLDSGADVVLTADYNDLLNTYNVRGSKQSRQIQMLEQHLSNTRKRLDSLVLLHNRLQNQGKTDSAKIIDSLINSTLAQQKAFSEHFVRTHYNSLVALPALSQVYFPGKSIFDPMQDYKLYFMVDSALGKRYPNNVHVYKMHTFTQGIKAQLQRKQQFNSIVMPGMKAPDFTIKNIEGQEVALSQFRGKYVYLLFWATWCEPCKQLVVQVKKLQNNKKIVPMLISLDINPEQLNDFLKKYSIPKNYVYCDYRFWNSPVVKKYLVRQLPTQVLIGPDMKILQLGKVDLTKVLH